MKTNNEIIDKLHQEYKIYMKGNLNNYSIYSYDNVMLVSQKTSKEFFCIYENMIRYFKFVFDKNQCFLKVSEILPVGTIKETFYESNGISYEAIGFIDHDFLHSDYAKVIKDLGFIQLNFYHLKQYNENDSLVKVLNSKNYIREEINNKQRVKTI